MSKNCRICNSNNLNEFSVGGFPLITCRDCGIIYNASLPTEEYLENYYRSEYKISKLDELGIEKRRIFRYPEQIELISEILKYKPANSKLLDIGCDRGYFLDEARRFGFQVQGIEPLAEAKDYCNTIGLHVFDTLESVESKFDIITMWHSLEHHLNPKQSLEKIMNYLDDDGILVLRVPAFDCIWRRIFGKRWIWFQPENHYFHYTKDSLNYLLHSSGYSVVQLIRRKPNNRITKAYYKMSMKSFKKYFESKSNFKARLSRFYQDLTGVELFAVTKKELIYKGIDSSLRSE